MTRADRAESSLRDGRENSDRPFARYLGISYFVHPIPLTAVALLIFNDHWLKIHHPSWLTGKLSDFAGLFFFPLFLCALVNLLRNSWEEFRITNDGIGSGGIMNGGVERPHFYGLTPGQLVGAIAITDLGFIAVKLNAAARGLYLGGLNDLGFTHARMAADPTDLIALVSSLLVYLYAQRWFGA